MKNNEKYVRWVIRFIALEWIIVIIKAVFGAFASLMNNAIADQVLFFGVPILRPESWHYETMFASIYIVWVMYLLVAAKNPKKYTTFISFTIWANISHGTLMIIQALVIEPEFYRFLFDGFAHIIPPVLLLILRRHDNDQKKKYTSPNTA